MLEIEIKNLTTAILKLNESIENLKISSGMPTSSASPEVVPVLKSVPEPDYTHKEVPVTESKLEYTIKTTDQFAAYALTSYGELSVEKKSQMSGILKDMGYETINDVPANKYDEFVEKVEKLKNA